MRQLRERNVEPAEDGLGHSGQLVQSSAEQEREHAPQLHISRVGRPYGSVVNKKDAVLPESAVIARVGGVSRHRLRLHLRELILLHELLNFRRAADNLSSVGDIGFKYGGEVRVGLSWSRLHGSQDAVQQGGRGVGAGGMPQGESALHRTRAGVHLQEAAVHVLGCGTLGCVV